MLLGVGCVLKKKYNGFLDNILFFLKKGIILNKFSYIGTFIEMLFVEMVEIAHSDFNLLTAPSQKGKFEVKCVTENWRENSKCFLML